MLVELSSFPDGVQTITKEVPFLHNVTGETSYRKEQLVAICPQKDGTIAIHGQYSSCRIPLDLLPLLVTALLNVQKGAS